MDSLLQLLIVEDDEIDVLNIRRSLKKADIGVNTTVAGNYFEAIGLLKNTHFDCIFLDYMLPGKDGLSLLKEIRELGVHVPIVVMTSQGDEKIAVEMMKAGAYDYIPKNLLNPEGLNKSLINAVQYSKIEKERILTERKLSEQRRQLNAIVDNVPIVLFIVDAEGFFRLSEGQGLKLLDLEPGEVVGKNVSEVYGKFPEVIHQFEKCLNGVEVIETVDLNGLFFETHYTPMLDEVGKVTGVLGVSHDITARIKTESALKEMNANTNALIENTQAGIWSFNSNYEVVKSNSVVQRDFKANLDAEIDIGANMLEIFPEDILKVWKPLFDDALSGKRILDERHYSFRDTEFDLEMSLNPIRNDEGEVTGVSVFIWNVSEYKKTQKELLIAKEEAEQSAKAKQDFLANMSHEIRTPMNAIMGFAALLKKTKLNHEQEEYLEAVQSAGDTLLVIINDILDLSKIEAGKLEFENLEFSLPNTIRQVAEIFKEKAKEKNIQFTHLIDPLCPGYLMGDKARLHQLLFNLVGNALKFTENGEVDLSVKVLKRMGGRIRLKFSVSDTGIGIPEEKKNLIFESFSQASTETTRKYGGTGLGLTICKKLVELQGGIIGVNSTLNVGSEFYFELEYGVGESTEKQREEKAKVIELLPRPDIKLLLVEDNPMNQLLAKKVISGFEMQLEIAGNGQIALDSLDEHTFDVILMDVQMPVMDGLQATQAIRAMSGEISKIPVIALTAHAISSEILRCKEAGMDDYVPKPFKPEELYAKIVKYVKKKEDQVENLNHNFINMSYIDELASGSEDFKKEIIELFLNSLPGTISKMDNFISENNLDDLYREVHAIKPSFAMFNVVGSEPVINELLQQTKSNETSDALLNNVTTLKEISQKVIRELESELKSL